MDKQQTLNWLRAWEMKLETERDHLMAPEHARWVEVCTQLKFLKTLLDEFESK